MTTKAEILHEVHREMVLAERKHGDQLNLPVASRESAPKYRSLANGQKRFIANMINAGGTITWQDIALEEVFETFAETDLEAIRAEALQAAAMFAQIARACDYHADND